jgi:peptide/nickel transport system substrate-binding protein
MSRNSQGASTTVFVTLVFTMLVACRTPTETVTVEVTRVVVETIVKTVDVAVEVEVEVEPELAATADATMPKILTICMAHEPASLYPYADSDLTREAILHAIFENDFTSLSFDYQAQGIEKIPSLDDGDAVINAVEVRAGDTIVDANGDVVILREGTQFITADDQLAVFEGNPASMSQMIVDFVLKRRVWSDGTPVSAEDSVYSFELDADPDTPTKKSTIIRTAAYEATGELNLRWTGIPGFLDDTYFTNLWRPLPRHIWDRHSPAQLLEAEESSRAPIGDGPYKVADWILGESIHLLPNEHYYRADQDLPPLDGITFKFIPDPGLLMNRLLLGQCDIGTHDGIEMNQAPLLIEAEANGILSPYFQIGTIYEHIAFGIDSWGRYGDGDRRPDWFEDVRVRQAMVMCTDRQSMVDNILYGHSEIVHSYVPNGHPLHPEDLIEWPYDEVAANQLLDEAGFLDANGDGIREDPITGTPFRVTLDSAAGHDLNLQVGGIFRKNLLDCGIQIELRFLPTSEWFARGSESPLFGRQFDLGQLAWPFGDQPLCALFTSGQITGPEDEKNRETRLPYGGWDAANATGWWSPEFDAACEQATNSLPGSFEYLDSHKKAQTLFAEQVPIIPLFTRLKVAAARPVVLNFRLDPTQRSELWNLFEIDLQR